MLLNCGVGEDSWKSLGLQGDPTSPSLRKSALTIHWKDWCWTWNSNTLSTWCEEPTHWKRSWCWERSKAEKEGDDRGWDGWMASPMQWTSLSKLWELVMGRETWRAAVMGLKRVRHDWGTERNWSMFIIGKGYKLGPAKGRHSYNKSRRVLNPLFHHPQDEVHSSLVYRVLLRLHYIVMIDWVSMWLNSVCR